jgi:predicted acetyltransferase
LQVFRKLVRIDGACVPVAAVGNVYTADSHRNSGLASRLLERALAALPAHGFALSLLFANRLDFYARFGWRSHRRLLSFIEPAPETAAAPRAAPFDPAGDLAAVISLYAAHSGAVPGATERDHRYWAGQLRYAGNPDERFVVARRQGTAVAYARATALYGFNAVIEHGCAPGEEDALADLFCHLHAGAASGTLAQLVPSAGLTERLTARALSVQSVDDGSWMWRIVDPEPVAAALRIPLSAVAADDFFDAVLPAERSRYWLSDRF